MLRMSRRAMVDETRTDESGSSWPNWSRILTFRIVYGPASACVKDTILHCAEHLRLRGVRLNESEDGEASLKVAKREKAILY